MPSFDLPHGPIWHGASVLVVDNEPAQRQLVRRRLEAEGFHVEVAPDGEAALAVVQTRDEPFDLVLTDLSMPGIDGRQVSETLARYRPSVAVLCMSANPDAVPRIGPDDLQCGSCSSRSARTISITLCAMQLPGPPI